MLMAQAAHETNGFTKKLAIENNNYAGIKYQPTLSRVAIPSTDFFAPKKEKSKGDKRERVPYAHFQSINNFVQDWIPYAHLNQMKFENKDGTPLGASDLKDFAHRLKLNHYYQDTEEHYLKGLKRWDSILQNDDVSNNTSVTQSLTEIAYNFVNKHSSDIVSTGMAFGPQGLTISLGVLAIADLISRSNEKQLLHDNNKATHLSGDTKNRCLTAVNIRKIFLDIPVAGHKDLPANDTLFSSPLANSGNLASAGNKQYGLGKMDMLSSSDLSQQEILLKGNIYPLNAISPISTDTAEIPKIPEMQKRGKSARGWTIT